MDSDPSVVETRACAFCGRAVREWLDVSRFHVQSCLRCATRLGRILVDAPDALLTVWPALIEEEPEEPEPRVRMPDGSSVELRQRTAELKKELTTEARLELAHTYGELGLNREQVIECGYVLSVEPPHELAQEAIRIHFENPFTARDAVEKLRSSLFPG